MPNHGIHLRSHRRSPVWALIGTLAILSVLAPPTAVAQDNPAKLPPLQVVVLVDESGSLTEADVVAEREAARTIAFSVLAPGSEVSVAGFGSSDAPGQTAVDVVCPSTVIDSAQRRDSLATCISELHRRSPEEGDGTDHASALAQALDIVRAGEPSKKVVFLLTDGRLDVGKSPAWGDTESRRNDAASARAKELLGDLANTGAQVWPLGFGDIDGAALRGFAKGKSCTPAAPDPRDQIARTHEELTAAVANAFSSASCVKYSPPDSDTLPQGGEVDLTVTIPEIASDASIVVYKRDSRVQVEYLAPNATKPAPAAGGTDFEFAGQSTETESVRIVDPEPGEWTVRLSAADVPTHDVSATVVYQAAVKANLTVDPPTPVAGQQVDVNMQVWARGRAVTDAQALHDLTFVATLEGNGKFEPLQVTLSDPDGDGTFAGKLAVPKQASDNLTFTGQVTGIGIGGDTRVLSTSVQSRTSAVRGQILFDTNDAKVTPGGTMTGRVSVTNDSGQPIQARLMLTGLSAGTALTIEPATQKVGAGTTDIPFTLRFAENTVLGANAATLRVVDAADPARVIAQRQLSTDVAPEPSLLEKLFWLWVALLVVLAGVGGFLYLRLRARLTESRVGGLSVQLFHGGVLRSEVEPRDPGDRKFTFLLHRDFTGPQLQTAGPGEPNAFEVRRSSTGFRLTAPGQPVAVIPVGTQHEIGPDLTIALVDHRRTVATTDTLGTHAPSAAAFNPFDSQPATPSSDPLNSDAASASGGYVAPAVPFTADPPDGRHAQSPLSNHAPAGDSTYLDPNNPFG